MACNNYKEVAMNSFYIAVSGITAHDVNLEDCPKRARDVYQ